MAKKPSTRKIAAARAVEPKTAEVMDEAVVESSVDAKAEEVKAEPAAEEAPATKETEAAAAPKRRGRPKKSETEKTAAKKTTAAKSAPKKAAEKETESVEEIYIEVSDRQLPTSEIVDAIKEQYKSEGHRVGSIKSLKVYMNIQQRKAYYVINNKTEGKFVEF